EVPCDHAPAAAFAAFLALAEELGAAVAAPDAPTARHPLDVGEACVAARAVAAAADVDERLGVADGEGVGVVVPRQASIGGALDVVHPLVARSSTRVDR